MNRRAFFSLFAAVACAPVAKLKPRKIVWVDGLGFYADVDPTVYVARWLSDRLPCALMDEAWLRAQPLTQAQALDYVAHWATLKASNDPPR